MLVSSTLYGNGYKTQDEPTIKFLEKMDELNIPVITCHTSRTRRPRMYQTSNRYNQAGSSYPNTYRSTRGNKGTNRQSYCSPRPEKYTK